MNNVEKNNLIGRIEYLDLLRIISTGAVMILHIAAVHWYDTELDSFEWEVFNFYDSIVRWAVPVFTMISGALFLGNNEKCSIKIIYKKYIYRIAIAFCFWSSFYAILEYAKSRNIKRAIISLIQGHYHMWFLFMIIGIYMILPFLDVLVKKENLVKYFLALAFLFAFVIPQINEMVSLRHEEVGMLFQSIVNQMHLHFVLGYTFYFLLGYYLNKITITRKMGGVFLFLSIGFISTIILTVEVSRFKNVPCNLFWNNLSFNVLFEAVFVFVCVKKCFAKRTLSLRLRKVLYQFSKYSFGAYLVHDFFISVLNNIFGLSTLSFHPLLSVPIIGVIVFVLSFSISGIMNHIPVINKYIV